ncbi:MAG: hypothetical protein GY811_29765 [Myxococcales bacterium]|nr:hypothetical protein [Myxococcales bacterium]
MSPSSVSTDQPITIRLYKQSLNVQRQQGEAAVSLIEQAGAVAPTVETRPEGGKGHILRTVA